MDSVLEILKYTLPAFIVFITAYLLIRSFLKNDEKNRRMEYVMNNQKIISPIRLQAYERATLFLERISMNSLINRTYQKGMTVQDMQNKMLRTIRTEFEHNYSQQIYMTKEAWNMIVSAKETTVQLVNKVSAKLKPDAAGMALSKALLEEVMELEKTPTANAIEFIKKEISQLF